MKPSDEMKPSPVVERRRAPRTRFLRQAHCVFNRGCSDFSALARNISATGALLVGEELFRLPEEFELQMANAAGAVMARRVRKAWSRPDAIGVEFLEPERELPPGVTARL
jgi:hypothetical protein